MNNHKSEYGVIQTIRFMIRQAVKEAPAVLVWLVVDAILALILQLLELYVTPVLLRDIEEQIALKELVTTILFFSSGILLLTGLKEYINNATYQGKIEIRMSLCKAITEKIGATSYCNLGKKDFQEKKERTNQATSSNSSATEIIWIQLNQLVFCILGFLAYLFVMKRMNVLILAVTILAAVVSYLAAQRSVVWLQGIMENVAQIRQSGVGISDVMELISYEEPYRFEDGEPLPKNAAGQYELRLENVSFRYPGASEDTLHNLNLTIQNGEKLAVVGRNGAGKSTLVKLLCGFFDPTDGCVLLNGEDIRKYNRKEYYRLFSAVFQDFSILPGTIAENVAQCVDEIDFSRVKAAVKDAGLEENIERLSEKYETKLGRKVHLDAYELSGGETQRLMLARALYRNAPVIVLDEPTAALDPIAESDLYERYHELTKGSTSIYVSHRLASTRFCDRIILIGAGGIAEMGTHEELMEAGKEYAHLYEVQSRYYTEGGMEDAAFDA